MSVRLFLRSEFSPASRKKYKFHLPFIYRGIRRYLRNMKFVKLSQTKDLMPTLGLGTWQASPEVIESTVYKALDLGYRHIDTAFNYNNEEAIGNAIKKWIDNGNGTRKDLFITTKLPHVGNRASDVKKFLNIQLQRLQVDYVDLYLIHVPFGFRCNPDTLTPVVKSSGEYDLDLDTDHISTWKVMEECQKEGSIRNLGLSNFNESQIAKIISASTVKPQVLQVELHAYFQQLELRKFCLEHDIVVTAYAPLGSPGAKDHFVNKYNYSPDAFPDLLGHSEVIDIAKSHDKSTAQVLLRFLVQQKVVVIPKSTSAKRLKKQYGAPEDIVVSSSRPDIFLYSKTVKALDTCGAYCSIIPWETNIPKDHTFKENSELYDFEITPAEMNRLKKLDTGEKGRIFNFLFWKGVENHPEYPYKLAIAEAEKN